MIMLSCEIADGALPHLKSLRLGHLQYIAAHRDLVAFGGPTRTADGLAETMIIVLETDEMTIARSFIADEPYAASGVVFAWISLRHWSQVLPKLRANALADDIALETARLGDVA